MPHFPQGWRDFESEIAIEGYNLQKITWESSPESVGLIEKSVGKNEYWNKNVAKNQLLWQWNWTSQKIEVASLFQTPPRFGQVEEIKKFLVLYTSKFMFQKPFTDFEIWKPSLKTSHIMPLMAPQVHSCMKYSMNLSLLSIVWVITFTSKDMISATYDMKLIRRQWSIFNFFRRIGLKNIYAAVFLISSR